MRPFSRKAMQKLEANGFRPGIGSTFKSCVRAQQLQAMTLEGVPSLSPAVRMGSQLGKKLQGRQRRLAMAQMKWNFQMQRPLSTALPCLAQKGPHRPFHEAKLGGLFHRRQAGSGEHSVAKRGSTRSEGRSSWLSFCSPRPTISISDPFH